MIRRCPTVPALHASRGAARQEGSVSQKPEKRLSEREGGRQ